MSNDSTSRHPKEDTIPERYEVNAFDQAVRDVVACNCSQRHGAPCKHVRAYNKARVQLLDQILVVRSKAIAEAMDSDQAMASFGRAP